MMRYSFALVACLAFLVLPFFSYAAQTRGVAVVSNDAAGQNWGRYHALVIGINAYEKWRPLQTAVRDATVLRSTLVNRYGFDEKNVVLLIDREATRGRIIRELRSFAGGLKEDDNLLIYYAGHGQLDDLTGDGYWIPVEGALKDSSTWVSNSILKGVLSSTRVGAKNVVVIADSCYSGSLLRDGPSMLSVEERDYTEKLAKAAALRSRQVISSGGVEPVADGGRDGHSLFAYYFLKALNENDREVIDLENLFHTRVWAPVTQIGDQRPSVGRLKTPMDEDGQFVLTNRARAEQIAAVKDVQVAQAAQQKAKLAALMAEKEKLEVERKRLELEMQLLEEKKKIEAAREKLERNRQLMEEQKKIEADRLERQRQAAEEQRRLAAERQNRKQQAEEEQKRVEAERLEKQRKEIEKQKRLDDEQGQAEQERQRLEAERLAVDIKHRKAERISGAPKAASGSAEQKRPPKSTIAAISPQANHPVKRPKGREKLDLAVFKWKLMASNPYFTDTGYIQSVENAFAGYRQIELKYVYDSSAASQRGISRLALSDEETDSLWLKKSFFSPFEPDLEKIFQYSERVGADIALICLMSADENGIYSRQYFLDVNNRRTYSEKNTKRVMWQEFGSALEEGWKDLAEAYIGDE